MLNRLKITALICFVMAALGFPLFASVIYGVTYVRHQGWQTYNEAPTAFIVNTSLSGIAFFGFAALLAFFYWLKDSKRQQTFNRPQLPFIAESHIAQYKNEQATSSKSRED